MMTSSETEVEKLGESNTEDSAILEVSTMAVGGVIKQESRDTDFLSNCSTSVEGSVIASPSVGSFSTLPEQEISDFQADSRDLQVKVDNPQKHLETLETYITFRITTKSTRPEFEEGEYIVRRRYNDFIWLRQKLVDSYPTHIIPPMPGKHTLLAQLDRYSKEFIVARMKLLHIFLNRVVNHPILSCDKNLHIFLTSKPAEFLIHRKNRGNVLVKMTDSLQNIASTYTMKQRHFEFEQIREYCIALSEKLATIDKINHRIQKDRQDYLVELHQLHPIFTLWATSEPELAPILLAIAKAIECNAVAHQKLLENVPNEEREYISYIDAVKGALSRRDSMQIEYEMTIEDLAKKKLEKDQLMGIVSGNISTQNWGGSLWKAESRDEKLERLGQAIPRLAKQAELLQDRVECANENLRSDLQRWNVEKQMDLKNMLILMADRQIRHYQQCMNAWEETLAGLKLDGIGSDVNVGSSIKIPI
ncbi:sorting nexin-30 [Megachile rotundata]|uniref:sorting nexin-30 n=1 Tax=Megachile rotundata TaxID=143995 RepID=UPI000258DC7F|nr:PREDICTED: sorting nexin-30-like isoform X1 [Megachile rotundata]XP_012135953.1 PREDICTED: sorting nexin-30-like isoform X1 [Megachile rotundata]